jgi:hypothetical protein
MKRQTPFASPPSNQETDTRVSWRGAIDMTSLHYLYNWEFLQNGTSKIKKLDAEVACVF